MSNGRDIDLSEFSIELHFYVGPDNIALRVQNVALSNSSAWKITPSEVFFSPHDFNYDSCYDQ